VKLTFRRVELQLAHTWTIARAKGTNLSKVIVVELTGADGTTGLGEAAPTARYKESADTVEAFLQKVNPRGLSFTDVDGSMEYLQTISAHDMAAKCAVNIGIGDALSFVHIVVSCSIVVFAQPGAIASQARLSQNRRDHGEV